jgi:hypothetical protein
MTAKKIILIVAGILIVIVLMILIFVGSIIGVAFYSIGNSDAAKTAKNFLSNNQKLKDDIGEVKDFGSIVTGSVNIQNDAGQATINLKVIGDKKTVNATVELLFTASQQWRVSSAFYVNDKGEKIILLDPYDSKRLSVPPQRLAA